MYMYRHNVFVGAIKWLRCAWICKFFHASPMSVRCRFSNDTRVSLAVETWTKQIWRADKSAWNGSRRRTCWCETPTSRVITPHIVPMSLVGVTAFFGFRWEPRCSENDWLLCLCNALSLHRFVLLNSSTCRSRFRFSSFSTDTCTCVGDGINEGCFGDSAIRGDVRVTLQVGDSVGYCMR